MTASATIRVEVACALPARQSVETLDVPVGCTAREAVRRSGIAAAFPELDVEQRALGIFSRAVDDDHVLVAGDRVEIYRPLLLDPKQARRQRAAKVTARR